MKYVLRCPICREKFNWPGLDGFPEQCPLCKEDIGADPDNGVAMPHISLKSGREADRLYRAMERGAEHRMNVASGMLGVPTSELSDMKMTNMRDDARVGESSNVPIPVNPVSIRMQEMANKGLPVGYGNMGQEHSGAVQSGPYPNAGAKFQSVLRNFHSSNGGVVSDMAALETKQPGYRRRG